MQRSLRVVAMVLGLIVLLTACGSSADGASVPLAKLTSNQEEFDGSVVRVVGRLRSFVDPDGTEYAVVEDAPDHRVLVEPFGAAQRFLRSRVTIVGCFTASPTSERTLQASSIVRAGSGRPHQLHIQSRGSCRPADGQPAA